MCYKKKAANIIKPTAFCINQEKNVNFYLKSKVQLKFLFFTSRGSLSGLDLSFHVKKVQPILWNTPFKEELKRQLHELCNNIQTSKFCIILIVMLYRHYFEFTFFYLMTNFNILSCKTNHDFFCHFVKRKVWKKVNLPLGMFRNFDCFAPWYIWLLRMP